MPQSTLRSYQATSHIGRPHLATATSMAQSRETSLFLAQPDTNFPRSLTVLETADSLHFHNKHIN